MPAAEAPKDPLLRPTTEIEGLGAVSGKRLADGGVTSIVALAACPPAKIVELTGTEPDRARRWNELARKELTDCGFLAKATSTALDLFKARKGAKFLSTGTKVLDDFFGDGLEAGSVTEVYGEAGAGKSQFGFTMCLEARKAGKTVIVIESENAFKSERIAEMARARKMDPDEVMGGISVTKVHTAAEMTLHAQALRSRVGRDCGLILIDSIANVFRSEMTGREYYTERAAFIASVVEPVKTVARILNVPAVIVNQVTTLVDGNQFKDNVIAWGGKWLAHAVSANVKIELRGRRKRHFKMIDSPSRPNVEAIAYIGAGGYVDDDPEEKRK